MCDIVVTGLGLVTALGTNVETTWENMIQGKSGVSRITRFDPSELDTTFAAEVSDDCEEIVKKLVKPRQRKQMTSVSKMLMVSAEEAIADSNYFKELYDPYRVGIFLGNVSECNSEIETNVFPSYMIVKSMINAPCSWLAMKYGIHGPSFSMGTACASSAYSICMGYQMIKSGMLDAVIVGGTDSHIEKEYLSGFNQLMALSVRNDSPETASRPFSKSRDGFVMGEGAGVLILEREDLARKRGAKIYARILGYGLTSEAFDITAPETDGVGMEKTMDLAIKNAGIEKDQVDCINAHGTSTFLNDKFETMAIKSCFGQHAYKMPVVSNKSMIGHTIAAAGAIESVVSILTMTKGIIPPTINYFEPDEELDLDYVPNKARKQETSIILSNSFGFGGHNASILYEKYID